MYTYSVSPIQSKHSTFESKGSCSNAQQWQSCDLNPSLLLIRAAQYHYLVACITINRNTQASSGYTDVFLQTRCSCLSRHPFLLCIDLFTGCRDLPIVIYSLCAPPQRRGVFHSALSFGAREWRWRCDLVLAHSAAGASQAEMWRMLSNHLKSHTGLRILLWVSK